MNAIFLRPGVAGTHIHESSIYIKVYASRLYGHRKEFGDWKEF